MVQFDVDPQHLSDWTVVHWTDPGSEESLTPKLKVQTTQGREQRTVRSREKIHDEFIHCTDVETKMDDIFTSFRQNIPDMAFCFPGVKGAKTADSRGVDFFMMDVSQMKDASRRPELSVCGSWEEQVETLTSVGRSR
ncbi:unnamed protein product [Pleuronectes platessa]|uniref:Uncharacterized protein n=1 Tax=Pleuronectes platessa TaxID=8262 RepID=A0A9N7VV04_PLEPL|nr:unnamed protein product [Pleuronectes platessa]